MTWSTVKSYRNIELLKLLNKRKAPEISGAFGYVVMNY